MRQRDLSWDTDQLIVLLLKGVGNLVEDGGKGRDEAGGEEGEERGEDFEKFGGVL